MADLNLITSVPAILVLLLVGRGFLPFAVRSEIRELRYFSRGMLWLIGAFAFRIAYWGIVLGVIGAIHPDLWSYWYRLTYGTVIVNSVLNTAFAIGGVYVLRGFFEMIPEHERDRWSWLSAPFYPQGWCTVRLARVFNVRWRNR